MYLPTHNVTWSYNVHPKVFIYHRCMHMSVCLSVCLFG